MGRETNNGRAFVFFNLSVLIHIGLVAAVSWAAQNGMIRFGHGEVGENAPEEAVTLEVKGSTEARKPSINKQELTATRMQATTRAKKTIETSKVKSGKTKSPKKRDVTVTAAPKSPTVKSAKKNKIAATKTELPKTLPAKEPATPENTPLLDKSVEVADTREVLAPVVAPAVSPSNQEDISEKDIKTNTASEDEPTPQSTAAADTEGLQPADEDDLGEVSDQDIPVNEALNTPTTQDPVATAGAAVSAATATEAAATPGMDQEQDSRGELESSSDDATSDPGNSNRNAAPMVQDGRKLAQKFGNPLPIYPREARLKRKSGQVILQYNVTEAGKVENVKVLRSSGYGDLDQSAVSAIKRWQFQSGQSGLTVHPVNFSLRGDTEEIPSRLRTSS